MTVRINRNRPPFAGPLPEEAGPHKTHGDAVEPSDVLTHAAEEITLQFSESAESRKLAQAAEAKKERLQSRPAPGIKRGGRIP